MVLIARYGEIFLKGKNRLDFEKKLVNNIKKMFDIKVLRKRNRLLVEDNVDLRRVFGLISYSPAVEVELDLEKIKSKILELIKNKNFETFAVAAKRMASKFSSSQEINEIVGEFVLKNLKKKVDLTQPDLTVGIEFIDDKAYVFTETINCFGGLPVGVEGKVLLFIENEKSLLAGLLMMKRGCDVLPVAFKDVDIGLLQKYNPQKIEFKKIKSIQELEELNLPLAIADQLKEETSLVILEPLVGLTQAEISKKISIFIRT
jgi:thiamine biosynthesis protein ThiI